VRRHLNPSFKFYAVDIMSPLFSELGRFDVILYLGVLYHTMYPFEQLVRLSNACNPGGALFLESEYYDLPGFEQVPTIAFNYDGTIVADPCSPVFPSIAWINQTLERVGFRGVRALERVGGAERGRVTVRAIRGGAAAPSPFLYAGEQT
jgi:hypothetical protein